MSREINSKLNRGTEDTIERIIEERISTIDFEHIFIIDSLQEVSREYTYLQFFSFVVGAIDALQDQKAREIITLMDNSLEMLVIYFACMLCGKVIIPVDIQKKTLEMEAIIREYPDAQIVSDEKYMADLEGYAYQTCHGLRIAENARRITKEQILGLFQNVAWKKDFQITYTSGTTGGNKGVVHSLYNLALCACIYGDRYLKQRDNVFAHIWSMSYMAGLENCVMVPFFSGSRIVLMERFSMKSAFTFWDKVIKYGVNVFWLSPTMLALLEKLGNQKVKEYLRHSDPTILIATAPLPMNLRKRVEKSYGITLQANYGLTETLFIAGEEDKACGDGGVGRILENVQIKISEDEEILIKAPWMLKRYTNVSSEEYFEEDYYKTGDLGRITPDGILYITGRKKNLIIKGGMNISPRLIEDILEKSFPELETAVFGDQGKSDEEIICLAYVVPGGIKDAGLERNIHNIILTNLGINYKIDFYMSLGAIPHNANGKVDLGELRKMRSKKHISYLRDKGEQ